MSLDDGEVIKEIRAAVPSHFVFKIESFSLLSANNVKSYETTEFEAGGYKWKLKIYPNGYENQGDQIAVYLEVANATSLRDKWEINVIFGIFLHNHKLDNFLCRRGRTTRFHALNPSWGFQKFISLKSFMDPANGYLSNDNCAFGAEVFVLKSPGITERLSMSKAGTSHKKIWKISEFSKLDDAWNSENFSIGQQDWKLMMHPNTNQARTAKDREISIFLKLVKLKSNNRKVHVRFKIQITDQVNGKHRTRGFASTWLYGDGSYWGWQNFISSKDMTNPKNGFLVQNGCIIETEISVLAVASTA